MFNPQYNLTGWKHNVAVYGGLFFANIIFAGAAVIYKISLKDLNPIILSFYRQMFSWPVLLIICYFFDRTVPKREDIKWFVLVGFLGIYLNQLFFTLGIKLAGAILAAVLQLAAPPIAAILAILFKAESFSIVKLGGIALAVIGAIVLVGPSELSLSSDRTVGIIVLLLQAVWIGLFLIFQKRHLAAYSPLTITTGIYMSGAPFISLTALIFVPEWSDWVPNQQGVGAVIYAVLAHSVIGYLILSFANRHTQSSIVAAMNCTQAPLVAVIATFYAGETFDGQDMLGTLIIICGLGVISYQRYKEQKEMDAEKSALDAAKNTAPGSDSTSEDPPLEVPPLQRGGSEKKIRVVVVEGQDGDDDEVVELEAIDEGSPGESPAIVPAT